MMQALTETRSAALDRLTEERQAHPSQPTKVPRCLPLSALHVEPSAFQVREEGLCVERVQEIAKGLDGSSLDEPIHVWWSGKRWIVIEGHHRHAAYKLKQGLDGKTLKVPVTAHSDIPLADALGFAGRLNNRSKVKISKGELMDNAWCVVCIGEGSIKQQSERCNVAESTISNMRKVKQVLLDTRKHITVRRLIDAGWKQSMDWANGRTQREFDEDFLEGMAQDMAKELRNLRTTPIIKSPNVFARAIEIVSPEMPKRLIDSDAFFDAFKQLVPLYLEECEEGYYDECTLDYQNEVPF